MSRRVWIVLVAFAAIVLVNNIDLFGRGGFGGFMNFVLTVLIIYRAYVLYQKHKRAVLPKSLPRALAPATAPEVTATQIWIVALIFGVVLILGAYQTVGAGGLNFFVWGDHLLGNGEYPVMLWSLAGLFFGAMVGGLIVWRKYHIPFKWCLLAVVPFFSGLFLLQALSDPLGTITPRPLAVAGADSTRAVVADTTPLVHKQKKRAIKIPERADTTVVSGCGKKLGDITINARSDSVTIYYRTASYRNGPWSIWRSKFVPQQGQFALTDDGQVRANGLQYYYQTKLAQTRSVQDPYTKLLCDGELIIDTY